MWNNGFEHQTMKDNDFLRPGKQMRWANIYTNLLPVENVKITDRDRGPRCSLEESLNWGDVAGKSDRSGQLELTGRVTERRELHSESVSEMYRGSHSGLQLYTGQGFYVEKLQGQGNNHSPEN